MAENTAAKQSLKLRAYTYIKDKILACEYAPGEFVNEQQLCEEMGSISRTPVRDALSRLEQEGLITILPKKGTVVTGISIADINHIYEVRLLVEPYALRQYGALIPREALRAVDLSQEDLARSWRDPMYFYRSDDAFHAMVVDAMPNRYLRGAWYGIRDTNMRFRVMCGKYGLDDRIEDTYAEHRAILTACMAGEWNSAAQAMAHHLEKSRDATFDRLIRQARADGSAPGLPGGLSFDR
jgi:DNA-binding GntR family transcriptional regulator